MAGKAAGKLISGLVVGAAVGTTVALVLSSRASLALPRSASSDGTTTGPTPFAPANDLIIRARHLMDEVRTQVRLAVQEGKATAAQTRAELTTRFEAAKRGDLRAVDDEFLQERSRPDRGKQDGKT